MTKFLTVTLLKYLIKFLRKMKNLIDKLTFSAAIPFFTKINSNPKTKKELIKFVYDAINLTIENYEDALIKTLIITYGIRKGTITPSLNEEATPSYHIYYNHKLPIHTYIKDYLLKLDIINQNDLLEAVGGVTIISLRNRKGEILVIKKEEGNKNHIKFYKNGTMMYEWTDHISGVEDNSLIREIGKTTILWKEGEIIWTKVLKLNKPISKKKTSSTPFKGEQFITMDIETNTTITNTKCSILNPYLICWYDNYRGINKSYLLTDFKDFKTLLLNVMKDLSIRKYKGYKIYIHNFSKFDAIFLIKYLVDFGLLR
jgi:hypothetical protein